MTDEPDSFTISDPDGTLLTLSAEEARRTVAKLREQEREGEPLSPALASIVAQIEERLT